MSKTRKILSVVLALAMVFSVLSVSASAAANYESAEDIAANNYKQEWVIKEKTNDGVNWTVEVYLTTNYPTGSIQFVVNNTNKDVAVFDYENVALGSGITYDADIKGNANGKVLIIPETSADTVTAPTLNNALVATLKYTYAGSGSAKLTIDGTAKTATTPAGTLIAARMSDGDIVTGTPIVGQPATVSGEVNIGSAAQAPELAVIDGTIGVIDTTRTEYGADFAECTGYIYGVEPVDGQSVTDVFEVVGDGEMEIVANEAGSEAGTGTIVNVLDADGNVVANYVLIIFGDIDGDGAITAYDGTDAALHDAMAYGDNLVIEDPALLFAGDVDVDGSVTAYDTINMELHDAMAYGDNLYLYQSEVISQL